MLWDTLWCFVILCDTLWCFGILCDTPRYCMMLCDALWYSAILCNTRWYSGKLCDTLWYFVILCDAEWYSWYSAILCDTLLRVEWRDIHGKAQSWKTIPWQQSCKRHFKRHLNWAMDKPWNTIPESDCIAESKGIPNSWMLPKLTKLGNRWK